MTAARPEAWRTLWRWHFYAGLLVMPFVVVLSLSGALYLFKPQVERWEERAFHGLPTAHPASPSAQVAAALAASPGARFAYYRLPERPGDAAMVHLAASGRRAMRDVFVSPQGIVLGSLDPKARLIARDRALHGQLLLGRGGSVLVELLASWTIVLIVSGLCLWWPRGQGAAGVVWPRLSLGGRAFWRDIHAVTGFWVSAFALVLLFTGLPWAQSWGSAFKAVRTHMGWVQGAQDWTIGGNPAPVEDLHAEHDHAAMATMPMAGIAAMGVGGMRHASPAAGSHVMPDGTVMADGPAPEMLDVLAGQAAAMHLAFPVLVVPPGMPAGEGGAGAPGKGWTIRSDAQNRPLRETLRYDASGTRLLERERFADKHPLDQIVAYGVAWHEGQLFGWVNQLVGLATALALVTVAVSGFVLWRRRKPAGLLGAPPAGPAPHGWRYGLLLAGLMVWLPLFTASLLAVLVLERVLLRRIPAAARWLGLAPA